MDPVSFLLLNETAESTAQCLESHFLLCTFVHVGINSPITIGKKSRAGAWAPST